MSRLVDIIHTDGGDRLDGRERLRRLLDEARAGGISLEVTADVEIPEPVENEALSVVREGLTNALKHAPGATVRLRIILTGEAVEIDVLDDGARSPSTLAYTGSGLGLTGMGERLEAIGGSLQAGPADGGWRVHARGSSRKRSAALTCSASE